MHLEGSKIILGAAQFGLNYGISNESGKSSESEVKEILNYSGSLGVEYIDTAALYGDSEKVIGRLAGKDWRIMTKTPIIGNNLDKGLVREKIIDYFNKSLERLNRVKIETLLIHSCDDLFSSCGQVLFETILELKNHGYIKKLGVSVYSKHQIDLLLKKYQFDIIQLPLNIFDQRLVHDKFLEKIKDNGVEIHVRSVFLQGLLLMSPGNIPHYFMPITETLTLFRKKASCLSVSPLSLALSYVNSIKEVDRILIGVNNAVQLREILESPILDVSSEDFTDLFVSDSNFVDPSTWVL